MPSPRQKEVEQLVFVAMGPKDHQEVGWNHSSFKAQGLALSVPKKDAQETFPVAPHKETDKKRRLPQILDGQSLRRDWLFCDSKVFPK